MTKETFNESAKPAVPAWLRAVLTKPRRQGGEPVEAVETAADAPPVPVKKDAPPKAEKSESFTLSPVPYDTPEWAKIVERRTKGVKMEGEEIRLFAKKGKALERAQLEAAASLARQKGWEKVYVYGPDGKPDLKLAGEINAVMDALGIEGCRCVMDLAEIPGSARYEPARAWRLGRGMGGGV